LRSTLSAELEEVKKRKKKKIFDMRLGPRLPGTLCAFCGWSINYEVVEFRNGLYCRPECALRGTNTKGKARLVEASGGVHEDSGPEPEVPDPALP
jgi:hypothetical protein